jgi:U4/U6.U5 tri-snRNP-associated protein 3
MQATASNKTSSGGNANSSHGSGIMNDSRLQSNKRARVDERFVDVGDSSDEEEGGVSQRSDHVNRTERVSEIGTSKESHSKVADDAPIDIPPGMTEEEAMAAMMGFSSFDSSHGKEVEDNSHSAARGAVAKVALKREYRQYMNRKGGFNRPLNQAKKVKRK